MPSPFDAVGQTNAVSSPSASPFDVVDMGSAKLAPTKSPFDTVDSMDTSSWSGFVQKAHQIASDRGFPANVLLGQAAVESARGQSAPGNNYFGIKGQGTAGANSLATQEYGNGGYYGENSNFAAYHNPEESINHYIDLVMSYPGVPQAVATGDSDAVIKAIENAGYATSPTYVQTIENTPEYKGGQ